MKLQTYAFYHKDTGMFHPTIVTCRGETILRQNTPPDHVPLEHVGGEIHPQRHRFDVATASVVVMTPAVQSVIERGRPTTSVHDRLASLEQELLELRSAKT